MNGKKWKDTNNLLFWIGEGKMTLYNKDHTCAIAADGLWHPLMPKHYSHSDFNWESTRPKNSKAKFIPPQKKSKITAVGAYWK